MNRLSLAAFGVLALGLIGLMWIAVLYGWPVASTGAHASAPSLPEPAARADVPTPVASSAAVEGSLYDQPLPGLCDASGAVWFGDAVWVVQDEDNQLFRFGLDRQKTVFELTDGLGFDEADLEAGALLGHHAYWIGSHDRGSSGGSKPGRNVFFRVDLTQDKIQAEVIERNLLRLMSADPTLAALVQRSVGVPAKGLGGLSIEGLAVDRQGLLTPGPGPGFLVGFRAPVGGGGALVLPISVQQSGDGVQVGEAIWLDLGGLGIRSLAGDGPWQGIAGAAGKGGSFASFEWDGKNAPEVTPLASDGLTPEAMFYDGTQWRGLSDDGSRRIGGKKCKDLPVQRRQARWLTLAF